MSLRDEIGDLVSEALSPDKTFDELADQILALLAPMLEKARKWDRATEVINPSHLYALAEWIDLKYPNDSCPEVQTDLRRLACGIA